MIQLIENEKDMAVCAEAETATQALAAIVEFKPNMVILDVNLKGPNGIDLMKSIKKSVPDLPVLVLSMHDEALFAERSFRAGARGYVMKQEASEEVLCAIRKVLAGEFYASRSMNLEVILRCAKGDAGSESSPVDKLSDRQLEVMQLIGRGHGTRQIAQALSLSVKTIESHRANIKEKLHIKTAPEMTRFAVEWVTQSFYSSRDSG